ncbi:MAG: PilZ domain-containing protein [Gammaproteobacteria bacterium]|nr:PilZ domain-containing protein [Gammaproteobacteria bacterium]
MAARLAEVVRMTDALHVQGVPVERRWSQRRTATLMVEIHYQGTMVANCQTLNVGLGGAYINCVSWVLPKGAEFELVFQLGDEHKVRHRLHARVIRASNDGVGVGFRDYDIRAFRTLQEVMRCAAQMAANPSQVA